MVPQPPIHKWVHFQVPIHTKKTHLKTDKSKCNYLIRNSPFFFFYFIFNLQAKFVLHTCGIPENINYALGGKAQFCIMPDKYLTFVVEQ